MIIRYSAVPVFQGLFVVFSLLVLSGCSILNPLPTGKGVNLQTRVEKMMEASIAGDWARVYPFLDSQYRKRTNPEEFPDFDHYPGLLDFTITDIQLDSSGTTAKVIVELVITSHGFEFNVPENQQWIKENGVWYRKVKAPQKEE